MNEQRRRGVFVHLAWFHREDGGWIGEWSGHLPAPRLPLGLIGDGRLLALNAWQQEMQRYITPDGSAFPTRDQEWDRNRWDACEAGGAVCLDVSRFAWPVGDHRWHRFDELTLSLDWPESSGQRFIQLDETLRVEAHLHTHRPARSIPGRAMLRITGTPLETFWGDLWGRFERHGERWVFVPSEGVEASGRPLVLPKARAALESPDLDLGVINLDPAVLVYQ